MEEIKQLIIVDWWSDVAQDEASAILAIRLKLVKIENINKNIVSYPKFMIYSRKVDQILYSEAVSEDPSFAERERGKIF